MQPVSWLVSFWASNLWIGVGCLSLVFGFVFIRWFINFRRWKEHDNFVNNRRMIIDERLVEERRARRSQILSQPIPEEQLPVSPVPAPANGPVLSGSTSSFIKQAEQSISREKLKDPKSYNLYDPSGVYDLQGATIESTEAIAEDVTFFPSSMRPSISLNRKKLENTVLRSDFIFRG